MMTKSNLLLMCFLLVAFKIQAQKTIILNDNAEITIFEILYKSQNKIYFTTAVNSENNSSKQLFYVSKSDFKQFKSNDPESGIILKDWDNVKANKINNIIEENQYQRNNAYGNRLTWGIILALVVPPISSLAIIETGIMEFAYIGLGSSAIGAITMISGVRQNRIYNDIYLAKPYRPNQN